MIEGRQNPGDSRDTKRANFNRELQDVRQHRDEDLEELARQELEQLKIGDKLYPLKYEPRCRVCTAGPEITSRVNEVLAAGAAYVDVLRVIEPWNRQLPKKRQISYNSVYTHAQKHLQYDKWAYAISRKVVERRAIQEEQDFVMGVAGGLNVFSYLEVMRDLAFKTMMDNPTSVKATEGAMAAIKLYELEKVASEDKSSERAWIALNHLIKVIKGHVSEEQMSAIYDELQAMEEPLDVEVEEDDEYEDVDPIDVDERDSVGE